MWDPNESFEFEKDDEDMYDPMDDDIEFDGFFLDNMSFNQVVSFLDDLAESFAVFRNKQLNSDWYTDWYSNPGKEVIVSVDADLLSDVEKLSEKFTDRKYKRLLSKYKELGKEMDFLKVCDITGITSHLFSDVDTIEDIFNE